MMMVVVEFGFQSYIMNSLVVVMMVVVVVVMVMVLVMVMVMVMVMVVEFSFDSYMMSNLRGHVALEEPTLHHLESRRIEVNQSHTSPLSKRIICLFCPT